MSNRFQLTKNEKLHVRLRRHELHERVETLSRHIKNHAGDPDFSRSLNTWRRQLMEFRLELSSLGS